MAYNFPSMFMSMKYDMKKKTYKMEVNPNFVAEVQQHFKKNQTLMLICRSGGRSAKATNLLAEAGFKNVYNVYDGFEGDKLKIENSYFNGQRMLNGWKNSGNPWTYTGEKDLVYMSDK
jgi:rhodanese-related sulfurtransferase